MYQKKPDWLKVKIQGGQISEEVKSIIKSLSLNTVCKEANCPNQMECFNRHTATFMILGKNCTRNCTFCNVTKGLPPEAINENEPANIAKAIKELHLKHAVITSVTRDDLPDGGASQFAQVVFEIRKESPTSTIELLIPDFAGSYEALKVVVDSKPDIINHNLETVPSLYPTVRPSAIYERSLELLKRSKSINPDILTKSGIMVGLGETKEQVIALMQDLRNVECDVLTIGQYLAPSAAHIAIVEYIHPQLFDEYKAIGLKLGFKTVASSPLVRSSYHADEVLNT